MYFLKDRTFAIRPPNVANELESPFVLKLNNNARAFVTIDKQNIGLLMNTSSVLSFVLQTLETDLRKYELEQANEQIKMLHSFMPESFLRRGGKTINKEERQVLKNNAF